MIEAPTWRDLLAEATRVLGEKMDARRIVEAVSGWSSAELMTSLDEPAPRPCRREVEERVGRRAKGEPLQYVVGSWGFRDLELVLDTRVLIPRPETEQVVEVALAELDRWTRSGAAAGCGRTVVADLGTGSGAIALSLATERPSVRVWATDSSERALAVARANLASVGRAASRVRLSRGSWFGALPRELRGEIALVVSNPPYVSQSDLACLPREVASWEPLDALVAGPTGLEALSAILAEAPGWVAPGGAAVLEMAPHQERAAVFMAAAAGFADVEVVCDLAGRARVVVGRR